MREVTGRPLVLAPERIAWRAHIRSLCEASDLKHNNPHTSELHPCDIDMEIESYQEDVALLQKLIQHKRNLISAFRCRPLPYEIMCRIFSECKRVDSWAPATVSHICRGWREVALRHRGLWNRIELGRRETGLTRASAWVERAGTLSVDLVIRYSEHTHRGDMISWLRGKADRIKSVTILHMDRRAKNSLLPSLPPFARMEALRILGLEDIDLDMRWIARILEGSRGLASLSLSGVGSLHKSESLKGVAAGLTHLSIGALSHIDYHFPLRADAVLEVISGCKGLRSLECHALTHQDAGDPPTVSLPSLSSLSIGDGPETCFILRYLHAPQLRSLRLVHGRILNEKEEEVEMPFVNDSENDYTEFFVDCLRSLQEACSPQITTVIWDRTAVDLCVLNHCTPYLRTMKELECHGLWNVGELAPCSFVSMSLEGIGYPHLQSISFTKCNLRRLDSIETAINQRSPPFSQPIMRLVVEDCDGVGDRYLSPLSNQAGAGKRKSLDDK